MDAIHAGLGMTAYYMGQTLVTREKTVNLPLTSDGLVDPRRVSYGKLQTDVDLHVMAVPLFSTDGRLGTSFEGSGKVYVDITHGKPQVVRSTTSHESGHAIGYEPPLHDASDVAHCAVESCLMSSAVDMPVAAVGKLISPETLFDRIARGLPPPPIRMESGQNDFCPDCKVALHEQGDELLGSLREYRCAKGSV